MITIIWLTVAFIVWYPAYESLKKELLKDTTELDGVEETVCFIVGTIIALLWIPIGVVSGAFLLSRTIYRGGRWLFVKEKADDE